MNHIIGDTPLTDIQFEIADINGDGVINIFDIVMLANFIIG